MCLSLCFNFAGQVEVAPSTKLSDVCTQPGRVMTAAPCNICSWKVLRVSTLKKYWVDCGAQEAGGVPCRLFRLSKRSLAASCAQAAKQPASTGAYVSADLGQNRTSKAAGDAVVDSIGRG